MNNLPYIDGVDFAVKIENLTKRFSENSLKFLFGRLFEKETISKDDFLALDNVSFTLRKGDAVGILGENGAGKSTLLQIIAKTLQPTSGLVEINGRLAALLELGSGFNPDFTGRENILLNASILGLNKSKIETVLNEIIEFSQIGEFVEKPVKTYSSGMLVRLAFAVSIFVKPDILIIDEALSVGDIFFRKKCFEVIRKFIQEKGTLLFVSHNEDQLRLFANRVIVLFGGKIVFDGQANEAIAFYNEKMGESRREYYTKLSSRNIDKGLAGNKNLRTRIRNVLVLNKKCENINCFTYKETIKIKISSIIYEPYKCLCFGILIRNKEGINIYSTETKTKDFSEISLFNNSEKIEHDSSFEFSFPIGKNSYSVEAYIIDRKNKFSNRIDWITNAAFFNIAYPLPYTKTNFKGGIADFNAKKESSWKLIESN